MKIKLAIVLDCGIVMGKWMKQEVRHTRNEVHMKKIKIKMKYGEIVDGYELDMRGEREKRPVHLAMVVIPPAKNEDCPCIVFADWVDGNGYDFKENVDYPFVNLYFKRYVKQLMKVYETCTE